MTCFKFLRLPVNQRSLDSLCHSFTSNDMQTSLKSHYPFRGMLGPIDVMLSYMSTYQSWSDLSKEPQLRHCPDCFNWCGKTHPKCGRHLLMVAWLKWAQQKEDCLPLIHLLFPFDTAAAGSFANIRSTSWLSLLMEKQLLFRNLQAFNTKGDYWGTRVLAQC